jgi:hypothetical protein
MIARKRNQKSRPRRKKQKTPFLLALRPQALSKQGLLVTMSRVTIPALGNEDHKKIFLTFSGRFH